MNLIHTLPSLRSVTLFLISTRTTSITFLQIFSSKRWVRSPFIPCVLNAQPTLPLIFQSIIPNPISRKAGVRTNQNTMKRCFGWADRICVLLGQFWSGHLAQCRSHKCCHENLCSLYVPAKLKIHKKRSCCWVMTVNIKAPALRIIVCQVWTLSSRPRRFILLSQFLSFSSISVKRLSYWGFSESQLKLS
jgi:hypothetical protein